MSTDGIAYSIDDTHPGVGVIFSFLGSSDRLALLVLRGVDVCVVSKFYIVELCFDEC
jgi:hypothetical protein